ncbi:hypothetical protein JT13_27190 [Klebsiella pneumoniae]|nr:hypothetical protein JT13_27190 [Klebsiella pneumoniae]
MGTCYTQVRKKLRKPDIIKGFWSFLYLVLNLRRIGLHFLYFLRVWTLFVSPHGPLYGDTKGSY